MTVKLPFTVKRAYFAQEKCYKYGIMKNGKLYEGVTLYGKKNADLVAEYLNMMDNLTLDRENGMYQIMQVRRIDKERHENGKVERRS